MPPKVSAVIINYNGENFLQECLDSLYRQTRPPDEIIVIDNASRDASLDLLNRPENSEVLVIPLPDNIGYASACNQGIRSSSGDLVALLNNDIVLDSEWLASLLAHQSDGWDFWASRIVFASNPEQIDSAGDGMAVVGSAFKIGHGQPASKHLNAGEVFGPCGAAALYTRKLLEETGGLDDDFFLIYEDADLSFRSRLLGYRCLYVPDALVVHRVNTNIGKLSQTYVYYGHRNSESVFWKNLPLSLLLLYLPERVLFNLTCFLYFLWKGRAGSFLKAKWDFFLSTPSLWSKRRKVQDSRKLATSDLKKQLDRNWLRYRRKASN